MDKKKIIKIVKIVIKVLLISLVTIILAVSLLYLDPNNVFTKYNIRVNNYMPLVILVIIILVANNIMKKREKLKQVRELEEEKGNYIHLLFILKEIKIRVHALVHDKVYAEYYTKYSLIKSKEYNTLSIVRQKDNYKRELINIVKKTNDFDYKKLGEIIRLYDHILANKIIKGSKLERLKIKTIKSIDDVSDTNKGRKDKLNIQLKEKFEKSDDKLLKELENSNSELIKEIMTLEYEIVDKIGEIERKLNQKIRFKNK